MSFATLIYCGEAVVENRHPHADRLRQVCFVGTFSESSSVSLSAQCVSSVPRQRIAWLLHPHRFAEDALHLGESAEVKQARSQATRRPGAALAQIVDTCPDKLPEDVRVVANSQPLLVAVPVFATVDDTLGVSSMVLLVAVLGIIISDRKSVV